MIPNHQEELETPAQRREAARPYLTELSRLARPEPVTLFGIEQHTLELLDFRQDVLERLAELQANPEAIEEREDACAELDACDRELRTLAGQEVAKVDQCANLLRMCDRIIEHRKSERDRQNKMAKRWEAIREGVENVVMEALTLAGRTRFDSDTNTLRMQRNSAASVEIKNPSLVSDRYVNVNVRMRLSKWKQIREALPDLLPEHYQVIEQTFALAEIGKVLKQATKAQAAQETMPAEKIERVKGAELRYGRHLRIE